MYFCKMDRWPDLVIFDYYSCNLDWFHINLELCGHSEYKYCDMLVYFFLDKPTFCCFLGIYFFG
jgi:hypothetical protein